MTKQEAIDFAAIESQANVCRPFVAGNDFEIKVERFLDHDRRMFDG
jgi:hypothetical protein